MGCHNLRAPRRWALDLDHSFLGHERRACVPVPRDDPAVRENGCFEWLSFSFVTGDGRHCRCVKDDHVGFAAARDHSMSLVERHP